MYLVYVKLPGEDYARAHRVTADQLMDTLYGLAETVCDVTVETLLGRWTMLVWLADRRPVNWQ